MKIHSLLIIVFIFQSACELFEDKPIENIWMPVSCIDEFGDDIVDCNYLSILEFKNDSIKIFPSVIETEIGVPYYIDSENNIVSERFESAVILSLSNNKLEIDFNGQRLVKFIPLPKSKKLHDADLVEKMLISSDWKFKNKLNFEILFEFECLNRNQDLIDRSIRYKSLSQFLNINTQRIEQEDAFWKIKEINNTLVLFIESIWGFDDFHIVIIDDNHKSKIIGRGWSLSQEYPIIFERLHSLSANEMEEMENHLVNGTWRLANFREAKNEHNLFGQLESFDILDTLLFVSRRSFKEKRISYKFNTDKSFNIFIGTKCIVDGTWEISKSGKIIKTQERSLGEKDAPKVSRYIFVNKLTNQVFAFSKKEELINGPSSFDIIHMVQEYKMYNGHK